MSLQSEPKLTWPEINLHFAKPLETATLKISDSWKALKEAFQGKQRRFVSYLPYLSTDFSGGFKVCAVLGTNSNRNPFSFPFSPPAPSLPVENRNHLWELAKNEKLKEVDKGNLELLGLTFLLSGEISDFKDWVEFTKNGFGLTDDCKRFLTLLGWEDHTTPDDNSILQMLVYYSKGRIEEIDFSILANAVMREGHWQFSGVLFDAISKSFWRGKDSLAFWEFLSGFYSDWKVWEQTQFLIVSLGKIPPYPALRKAKKYLSKEKFVEYHTRLNSIFRGTWEAQDTELGYGPSDPSDLFILTLLRFHREGDKFLIEIESELAMSPYSYFLNLQAAIIAYRQGDFKLFLEQYALGGRLRYLPIPLYLFAKVKESRKEEHLASSIFETLERLGNTPVFPSLLGEI